MWAGVDSAWEQGKLEAWKMLENAVESHTSGARCVGQHVLQQGFPTARRSFLLWLECQKTVTKTCRVYIAHVTFVTTVTDNNRRELRQIYIQ